MRTDFEGVGAVRRRGVVSVDDFAREAGVCPETLRKRVREFLIMMAEDAEE